MKKVSEFKRGECFWHHSLLYKVINKYDKSIGYLRAKCISDNEIERFENPDRTFSIKAI